MECLGWTRLPLAAALWAGGASIALAASPAPAEGENGMVVTAQHLATDVGLEVLKAGGNAVDAAVAVGYALAVTYPTAGNLGGGGFMTIRLADGTTTFLDFRERAPLAATKNMYLDDKGEPVPGASTDTYLAVGVPGSVAGFETAREKYGTKTREELIAPALRLARDGFVLEPGDVASFADGNDMLALDPAAAKIFLKDGQPLPLGATLVQADLARTLDRDLGGRGAGLLHRRDRRADRQGERGERRHPRDGGLRGLRGARARAGGVQLPRLRHRLVAAAVVGRADHLRDPEHPRGLSDLLPRLRLGGDDAADGRGDAPRLCRPQHRARRPGLRGEPGREADQRRLCRGDPGRDRPLPRRRLGRPDARGVRRVRRRRRTIRSSTRTATPSPSPTR